MAFFRGGKAANWVFLFVILCLVFKFYGLFVIAICSFANDWWQEDTIEYGYDDYQEDEFGYEPDDLTYDVNSEEDVTLEQREDVFYYDDFEWIDPDEEVHYYHVPFFEEPISTLDMLGEFYYKSYPKQLLREFPSLPFHGYSDMFEEFVEDARDTFLSKASLHEVQLMDHFFTVPQENWWLDKAFPIDSSIDANVLDSEDDFDFDNLIDKINVSDKFLEVEEDTFIEDAFEDYMLSRHLVLQKFESEAKVFFAGPLVTTAMKRYKRYKKHRARKLAEAKGILKYSRSRARREAKAMRKEALEDERLEAKRLAKEEQIRRKNSLMYVSSRYSDKRSFENIFDIYSPLLVEFYMQNMLPFDSYGCWVSPSKVSEDYLLKVSFYEHLLYKILLTNKVSLSMLRTFPLYDIFHVTTGSRPKDDLEFYELYADGHVNWFCMSKTTSNKLKPFRLNLFNKK